MDNITGNLKLTKLNIEKGKPMRRKSSHKRNRTKHLIIIALLSALLFLTYNITYFIATDTFNKPTLTSDIATYTYIVKSGDTVWDIANKVSTPEDNVNKVAYYILRDNQVQKSGMLQPGQVLNLRCSYKGLN